MAEPDSLVMRRSRRSGAGNRYECAFDSIFKHRNLIYRMHVAMAPELAQLGSRTADTPQPETEPEKEDMDFKFNGSICQNQGYRHHHPEI